ncbi:hypothetical protein ES702_03610 [subsurface metagenome]
MATRNHFSELTSLVVRVCLQDMPSTSWWEIERKLIRPLVFNSSGSNNPSRNESQLNWTQAPRRISGGPCFSSFPLGRSFGYVSPITHILYHHPRKACLEVCIYCKVSCDVLVLIAHRKISTSTIQDQRTVGKLAVLSLHIIYHIFGFRWLPSKQPRTNIRITQEPTLVVIQNQPLRPISRRLINVCRAKS